LEAFQKFSENISQHGADEEEKFSGCFLPVIFAQTRERGCAKKAERDRFCRRYTVCKDELAQPVPRPRGRF